MPKAVRNLLAGHEDGVRAVRPDGQRIVTASADKTARLWPVETLDQLLVRGCTWLHSYLIANPQTLATLTTCQTPGRTRAAAPNLVADSDRLARTGNLEAAIQGLTTAKRWDPSLSFDPVDRARALAPQK